MPNKTKGFFSVSESGQITEKVDHDRARRLRRYVASRGWFLSRQRKKWGPALGALRRALDDDEQIDQVLDFIVKTRLDRPKIRDGEELRRCWNWITDLIEKKARDCPTISEEAQQLAKEIGHISWPKGSKADLPLACEITLKNVRDFKRRLQDWLERYPDNPRHTTTLTVKEMLYRYKNPVEFTRFWLRHYVNPRLQEWPQFSGRLIGFAWSLTSKLAIAHGHEIVGNYSHRPFDWDKVVKEVSGG